jgi:hypothetical protein
LRGEKWDSFFNFIFRWRLGDAGGETFASGFLRADRDENLSKNYGIDGKHRSSSRISNNDMKTSNDKCGDLSLRSG